MHVLLQSLLCWVQNRMILNCITTAPDCMLKVNGNAMSNDPANMTMHIPCQPLERDCCIPNALEPSHRYFCLGLDGIFPKCLKKTKQYICRRAAFNRGSLGRNNKDKNHRKQGFISLLLPSHIHYIHVIYFSMECKSSHTSPQSVCDIKNSKMLQVI